MKKPIIPLLILSITQATTHPNPKTTPEPKLQENDQYIAIYECRNGRLKLIWHSQDLTPQQLKELKKLENQPCDGP